jgi:hypothetical protein
VLRPRPSADELQALHLGQPARAKSLSTAAIVALAASSPSSALAASAINAQTRCSSVTSFLEGADVQALIPAGDVCLVMPQSSGRLRPGVARRLLFLSGPDILPIVEGHVHRPGLVQGAKARASSRQTCFSGPPARQTRTGRRRQVGRACSQRDQARQRPLQLAFLSARPAARAARQTSFPRFNN